MSDNMYMYIIIKLLFYEYNQQYAVWRPCFVRVVPAVFVSYYLLLCDDHFVCVMLLFFQYRPRQQI